jgi:antitoxin HicB
MSKPADYPFEIRPLSAEEGGGFLISYLDFSDCISDGETVEEAKTNGEIALKATIEALNARNLPVPRANRR